MKITKCIIIEDEPLAQDIIETYLSEIKKIELIAKFNNALSAIEYLQNNKIDLIFLDIKMPKVNGIAFIKTLKNPPKIIITSAYRDYAIEGFDLNVVDYMLKPISFERFLLGINRFFELHNEQNSYPNEGTEQKYFYVNSNRKNIKINFDDILFIECMKDYLLIRLKNRKVITKMTISNIEKQLNKVEFIRIHRSFIVAKQKIDAFTSTTIEIGKHELPIGRNYKETVLSKLLV